MEIITQSLKRTFYIWFVIVFIHCKNEKQDNASLSPANTLFTSLSSEKTGINFQNEITEGVNTNVLMYEYFYNGGGVAVGDINNDGLDDIYFTANMTQNKLYLNKGNMVFEDITAASGTAGREGPWKTGVTMADVNGDGLLDIYVSYSGSLPPQKRENQLFINVGNDASGMPHFEDKAAEYGLNSPSFTTQAAFFDMDRDGDLDMFLLNHNPKSLPVLDESSTAQLLSIDDPNNGLRLFKNEKGRFQDVTKQAGIRSTALSYGLGIGVADFNNDGWSDLYVSNDYTIPDYLYLNNKNGTFTDQIASSMGHTSQFSMGCDVADVNNDGWTDIFTLDMLPEDNARQKLLTAPDNYEKFDFNVKVGFNHQYMRNMLHLNNGISPLGSGRACTYSEIGQLAGISNTDWSWAALFADYDNDGWKDLYITNGYLRDYTNLDFLKYMSDYIKANQGAMNRQSALELVKKIPSSNLVNYIFRNNGDLTFSNETTNWGLGQHANSNGAAYADLDNDGDLDLIVNNINQTAFIYQNNADKYVKNNYLRIKLKGDAQNAQGLGAKVFAYVNGNQQMLEQMPTRGFQSSVSPTLHMGLGKTATVDTLKIVWLSGKTQILTQVPANQTIIFEEKNATFSDKNAPSYRDSQGAVGTSIFKEIASPIAYTSVKNAINDFKRQPLMVNPLSFVGPCIAKGDVNSDGLQDVYVGGGSGQSGAIFIQQKSGQFTKSNQTTFEMDKMSDDSDALFFDANGDNKPDLYVCSGGYAHFQPNAPFFQDRLYLNDGKGNFIKSTQSLPNMPVSTSCVRASDINADGKMDLFVGGRVVAGRYPEIPQSFILINQGQGIFKDETRQFSTEMSKIGMVTDAAWYDLNGDAKQDLIIVGEWMPIMVFINENNKLVNKTADYFTKQYKGWWNKLLIDDFNKDGKPDLIVGNQGTNTQCKVSDKEPAELFYKDFDNNGAIDPILCTYIKGKPYPYVTRDELLDQMSIMRPRFPDYKSYANTGIYEVFTKEELKGVGRLEANYLKTAYFSLDNTGKFEEKVLPIEVQISPVFAVLSYDFDKDGYQDLWLGGNISRARLRFGKYDANYGILLRNKGNGEFSYIPQGQSGFILRGDVRSVISIKDKIFVGVNQEGLRAFKQ